MGYVGIICTDLSLADCGDFAAEKCKQICTETYGRTADVIITGDVHATIAYIPEHLDYILFELVKNAMRYAVCSPMPSPLVLHQRCSLHPP